MFSNERPTLPLSRFGNVGKTTLKEKCFFHLRSRSRSRSRSEDRGFFRSRHNKQRQIFCDVEKFFATKLQILILQQRFTLRKQLILALLIFISSFKNLIQFINTTNSTISSTYLAPSWENRYKASSMWREVFFSI